MQIKTDLLFYLILLLPIVNAARDDCKRSSVFIEFNKFQNNVLKRRIRAVVFPKNAQLVLTPTFTKALLGGRPKGLQYSMEFDMYSPLPDTIEGWKPTILFNNLKKQNNASQPSKVEFLENETHSFQDLPENLIDHTSEEYPLRTPDHNYYSFPTDETGEQYDDDYFKWIPQLPSFSDRAFKRDSLKKSTKFQDFAYYFQEMPHLKSKNKAFTKFPPKLNQNSISYSSSHIKNQGFTDRINFYHSKQNIRERRQIFKQLHIVGNIFKINMIKCLQRATCELTANFRPYGESVIEDILRLILIPSYGSESSNHNDKSNENYNNGNCKQQFATSCPYSIHDFLIKKK